MKGKNNKDEAKACLQDASCAWRFFNETFGTAGQRAISDKNNQSQQHKGKSKNHGLRKVIFLACADILGQEGKEKDSELWIEQVDQDALTDNCKRIEWLLRILKIQIRPG